METIQNWLGNTHAVRTAVPEKLDEWRGVLEGHKGKMLAMGADWQNEVAFVEALLAVLRGEKPVLPNDNPYADLVKGLLDALDKG